MIIDGKIVPFNSEGTKFGGATLNDRVRDEQGKLVQDTIPLTYGGLVTLKAGSDTLTGTDEVDVESVALSVAKLTVKVGAVSPAITSTVLPANATNKIVVFSSQDVATATVTQAGVVTGVAIGSTTIDAIVDDQRASVKVTVTAA